MQIVYILDNRTPVVECDFEKNARLLNYYSMVCWMVNAHNSYTSKYSVFPKISHCGIANSPTSCKLVAELKALEQLEPTFNPRYSLCDTDLSFYCDGLNQIASSNVRGAKTIVIVIPDFAIGWGNKTSKSQEFLRGIINEIVKQGSTIRIIFVNVFNSSPEKERFLDLLFESVKSGTCNLDKSQKNLLEIVKISNHQIYFEEELKNILRSSVVNHAVSKLALVDNFRYKLSINFLIIPASVDSCAAMHVGLFYPEIFSIIDRSQLNPLYIKGNPFIVMNDSMSLTRNMAFDCLLNALDSSNKILILRVKRSTSCMSYNEFWCLIPPDNQNKPEQISHMVMLQLQSSEMSLCTHLVFANFTESSALDDDITGFIERFISSSSLASSNYDPQIAVSGELEKSNLETKNILPVAFSKASEPVKMMKKGALQIEDIDEDFTM